MGATWLWQSLKMKPQEQQQKNLIAAPWTKDKFKSFIMHLKLISVFYLGVSHI